MWSYVHTCGSLHENLLLALQGTIAYAMSPHVALTDWTARAASCGCIAVFDCKVQLLKLVIRCLLMKPILDLDDTEKSCSFVLTKKRLLIGN
jgi:hypothetical protein